MTDNKSIAPTSESASVHTTMVGELTGSIAPMPTDRTIRARTNLPYQAYRFGRVNLRMLKLVRRSHTN